MDRLKILLVDDERDLRMVVGAYIKKWGFELIEAASGQEALDALTGKRPDIMILDFKMPGMDGIATLKKIRNINREIPVVMFTAYPQNKPFKESVKLGIRAFVPKVSPNSDIQSTLKASIELIVKDLEAKRKVNEV